MAQTLLQLVNRLRRKLRAGDTSESVLTAGSDPLDLVCIDLINDSGDYALGENEWSFEVRTDGVVVTFAKATAATQVINLTQNIIGDTTGVLWAAMNDSVATDFIARIVIPSLTDYGDTAFTIRQFGYNSTASGSYSTTLEDGSLFAGGDATICANEYVLPGTVRRVISVKHQERDVRLEEATRDTLDRYTTRPHATISDDPDLVIIGGYAAASVNRGSTVGVPQHDSSLATTGTSFLVYPTPESRLYLHYSYVYAYPRLVDATDTWDGIDQMVETAIVELAYAKAMQTDVGKDPEAGIALEQRARLSIKNLHDMDSKMPGYHKCLRSNFSGGYGVYSPGRFPRHFGTGN